MSDDMPLSNPSPGRGPELSRGPGAGTGPGRDPCGSGCRPDGSPGGSGRDPDRPTARGLATWGPWVAIGGTVLALVLGLILALPVMGTSSGETDTLGTNARIFVQLMTGIGFLLAPFLIASQAGGGGLGAAARRLGLVSFRPVTAAKWIGIALVGYIAFAWFWAAVFGEPKQEDIAGRLGPVWTQVLLIAILAPISEEICFRGFLFGGFRQRAGFLPAAIGAGLVFGLLHFSTGWSTVPQLAVLGIAFALVYERTGSLWPPIIFHAMNNAFVLATLN